MLDFIFALLLTAIWAAFAIGALCVASADDPTSDDHEDPNN